MTQIQIPAGSSGFAEDKDTARQIRIRQLLPALESGEDLVLDFASVNYATQSYVHALIGEVLRRFGEDVLDRIEFKSCTPSLRSVIELVVDYSLGGFPDQEAV
ncbi:MAG: STAS-like domain-containing protein [Acidobacteriota bacterium]